MSHYLRLDHGETYLMTPRQNGISGRSHNGGDLRSSSSDIGSGLFDYSVVVDLVAVWGVRFFERGEGYSSTGAALVDLRDGIVDEMCERAKLFHGEMLMITPGKGGLFLYVSQTMLDTSSTSLRG